MISILIFTVHKAASMFVHRLTKDVTKEFKIPYYSINSNDYYNEIRQSSWRNFIENQSVPGCFGPIRTGTAEPTIPEKIDGFSILLHLRDPRDVLTSHFFSQAYSHKRKDGRFNPSDEQRESWINEGIDKHVRKFVPEFKKRYQLLISTLLGRKNVVFVKYEDMVSDYSIWLDGYLLVFSYLQIPPNRLFGFFPVTNSFIKIRDKMNKKYQDEFVPPQNENIYENKRQITPGDHKRKLTLETIEYLNDEFSQILLKLNYG